MEEDNESDDTRAWEYPSGVSVPPKKLLRSLYLDAMMEGDSNTEIESNNDQQELSDLGILSFRDVLLPAIALMEDQALKRVQSVVQRDFPHATKDVMRQRQALAACMIAARQTVEKSRRHRLSVTLPELERKLREEREQKQREEKELRELKRSHKLRELKKKHPINQDLWRETAFLMTESRKLEKEEKLWKEFDKTLCQQMEGELATATHNDKEELMEIENLDPQNDINNDNSMAEPSSSSADPMKSMERLAFATTRMEQALKTVKTLLQESERVRASVYKWHQEQDRFQGYLGVRKPKDLIRILSQEDET